MSEQKVMNRWMVALGAVAVQLALGAIYAWSVFTPKLTDKSGSYQFTATQSQWIFSVGLAVFALVMIYAGKLQQKIGPKKVCMAGGIVLGVGYILGGFLGSSFFGQLLFIGVVGGAGIGLGYVVPIAVGMKWFPDKKGLITGLAVAGFGFGALIWVKLGDSWWFGGKGLLNDTSIFGLPVVQSVFLIYGVIFALLVLLGSTVMVNPPAGWLPEGYKPPVAKAGAVSKGTDEYQSGEMLRTPQFYALWTTFLFSAMTGLMVIGIIKLFGIDALTASLGDKESASKAAGTAMAWFAIFNGLGRIAWGMVSDKIGRKMALTLMCLFQGIIMLAFYNLGQSVLGMTLGAWIIGFNFGGNFALFPGATADNFGTKSVGVNYPWVFTSYGFAGIFGPQLAAWYRDAAKASGAGVSAWQTPFIIAGVACLLGAVITFATKPPHHRSA
jgi:OFA family oxalate/formate antiporter-like MFS transporter